MRLRHLYDSSDADWLSKWNFVIYATLWQSERNSITGVVHNGFAWLSLLFHDRSKIWRRSWASNCSTAFRVGSN